MVRLLLLFMVVSVFQVSAVGLAKNVKLSSKQQTLQSVFEQVKVQTGKATLFSNNELDMNKVVRLGTGVFTLEELYSLILQGTNLDFEISDTYVVIRRSVALAQDSVKEKKSLTIKGVVRDEKKEPIPGVTVLVKGTLLGISTSVDGTFKIEIPTKDVVLRFTFVGMETKEVKLNEIRDSDVLAGKKNLEVMLKESVENLDDVVVTGYSNIRKSSFTGSTTQVKKEELLRVSPGNIIDALQVFDPSLRMIRNNLMGSDPNTLPEFYIRGRSGMNGVKQLDADVSEYALVNNPNLPVFIMDGYEVKVEKVYDLDPNRIASITILKDAAATAMYGSRASNGVIVIETVAPQPGKLRVSYNFTGALTAPDLSDYNLANAREKMDVELAAGLLDEKDPLGSKYDTFATRLDTYRQHMNAINLGVDTYWLSQPLQTEFNHKHSLLIDGGVESIRFSLGLRYENQNGVMKKSYRDKIGGDFKIDYRIGGLQLANQISLDIMKSQNSPYGSFADYAKQQPYFKPFDNQGNPVKIFSILSPGSGTEKNPLYEALCTTNFNRSDYKEFTDNAMLVWYFWKHFQLKGQFAISYKEEKSKRFIDPESGTYDDYSSLFERGELFVRDKNTLSWNLNALLVYTNSIDKHNINFSLGYNALGNSVDYKSTHYRGFPNSDLSEEKYAKEMVGLPEIQDNRTRLLGTFLTLNYTYNDIYLFDASVRFDGSSEFGSNNRWATFWSGGAGINLHNYDFMKNSLISLLRLKANYGQTGKVNFPPYAARHTYEVMMDNWHTTGIGATLYYMGNTNLEWEKANTWNLAADIALGKYVNLEFVWYDKRTKDLISDVTIPVSSGFTAYKENMGEVLNRGIELNVNTTLVERKDWGVNAFVNMAHNKNKILKISNSLKAYNDRVDDYFLDYNERLTDPNNSDNDKFSKPVMKYEESGSLTSIFGMKSLGIAPANGNELYENRDGSVTYTWNSSQQQIIGNEEPKLQGSFGINARYKGFTLYTTFLFECGGDSYNQTLVDNVENVNLWQRNVDMRVLSMRWQKPGDVAPFKSIKDRYRITRPTSRFVQKNNMLAFNSLSVAYDVDSKLISKWGLGMLRLQFNMKDIATFSTVKQERGLSYPFARTFNLSINASF